MTHEGYGNQLETAIDAIRSYVSEITGETPTDAEIARALTRYFVLKEICEHIEMQRGNPEW
ncbi:MAG: hypothetical protein HY881_03975 [Deltaproteobacteria bacterium]|nr:hypothetical protein [Deltaproteobacteria bacterium]